MVRKFVRNVANNTTEEAEKNFQKKLDEEKQKEKQLFKKWRKNKIEEEKALKEQPKQEPEMVAQPVEEKKQEKRVVRIFVRSRKPEETEFRRLKEQGVIFSASIGEILKSKMQHEEKEKQVS